MTMPSLVANYKERVIGNQLKKVYSTLSQAIKMAESEYGEISEWPLKDGDMNSTNTIYTYYIKPYLNITKECKNSAECFSQYNIQMAQYYTFQLNDGSMIALDLNNKDENPDSLFTSYGIKNVKGFIEDGISYRSNATIKKNSLLFQNIVAHITQPYPQIKLIGCVPLNEDYLILDTINQIRIRKDFDNKYIWALLNSKLLCWYVYLFIYAKAVRTMHFDRVSTDRIPIKFIDKDLTIISLVDDIIETKRINRKADTSKVEQKIDYLVYKIYGLTYDEVLIVDPQTPITREEYETQS